MPDNTIHSKQIHTVSFRMGRLLAPVPLRNVEQFLHSTFPRRFSTLND